MNILAIDTSNQVMGVAITTENKVIGETITNIKKNHSVRVMPAIEDLVKNCGLVPTDLDKIVVAQGPGSYTGVRIGVTIAKTMAWALNVPLVGVSSLEVLAANGRFFDGYISPLFDARRGQIFTGLYQFQSGKLVNVIEDQLLLATDWAKQLKDYEQQVLFIGNDLSIHQGEIEKQLTDQAVFSPVVIHNPRPSELAFLGLNKEPVAIHAFVPNYLRLAEAEANWLAAQKKNKGD